MDIEVGTALSGASLRRKWLLTAAVALAATACVNPAFRESVGTFGAATKAAATAQNARLSAISTSERERILDGLAERRAYLDFAPSCNRALLGQESTPGECTLIERSRGAVPSGPRYEHIVALDNALTGYGESLIALAADSTADQAAFTASVTSVATSLGKLNNAIRTASGAPEADLSAPLGAVANLVAELGNLYFAQQRNQVLRRVIREGAPAVRRAITLLTRAAAAAAQLERSALAADLNEAQSAAADLARQTASAPDMRRAHGRLFDRLDALNRYESHVRLFQDMGVAHDRLVAAAQRGASAEDLRLAINAVIHLAATANGAVTALRGTNGSNGNGN